MTFLGEPRLLDLVSEQHPRLFPRRRDSKGKLVNTSRTEMVNGAERTVIRKMANVVGITLHQTACVFGPLDQPERRYRRALGVPAHVVAFRDGVFAQGAPLAWFLYHGNATNEASLGLECEGHYPGLLDDPTTPVREDEKSFWAPAGKTPTPLTPLALETFKAALRFLVEEGRRQGAPIRYIWAHRQASSSRRSDPGQELWRKLVVEYAQPVLQLEAQPWRVWADGRAIPQAWDPTGKAPY